MKKNILKAVTLMSTMIFISSSITSRTTFAEENPKKVIPQVAVQQNQIVLSSDSSTEGKFGASVDEPVDSWMPDRNVQNGVSKTLGITAAELTKEKVSEIGTKPEFNQLNITGATSLQGLEYATGGKSLAINVTNGTFSDLSPLAGVEFSILNITNNNVTDLSPLRGKALSSFTADNNEISDLSSLNFSQLYQISIENNHILA